LRSKNFNEYSPGFDERRVREIIDHYENQIEEEAVAEDEAPRRRSDELRRPKYTEEEINKILEQEPTSLAKLENQANEKGIV
jgi:hypothetical protein